MRYHKIPFLLSGLSAALLLASCGGGSSSSTTTTATATTSSAVISGTVPGTKIEAFCADGSYYKVNSTDDGSSQHPFSLSVPAGVDCHLVMTTNENDAVNRIITPIEIESGSVTSGVINVRTEFALGYVPLALSLADIVDTNGDGVVDTPLKITPDIPEGVVILDLSVDPLDDDHDGIPNIYEDDDGDGEYNLEDTDDDNDGIPDVDEADNLDHDGDGVDDLYDRDDDNDGLTDDKDNDDDNDGIPDSEDSDHDDNNETGTSTSVYMPVSAYKVTTGRLLASQCAQCHGTNGQSVNSWDSLAGESASELVGEMLEIKAGQEAPIMQAQAHGYSDAEIQALAAWFATQPGNESEGD